MTIRFCTVYGAGARGIADSGLAGFLQPLASSPTQQASMARTGKQVANEEPFGDEAGQWTQQQHTRRVSTPDAMEPAGRQTYPRPSPDLDLLPLLAWHWHWQWVR